MFGELEGHFFLAKRHLFTMPNVHLTAEVKDQHLQTVTETWGLSPGTSKLSKDFGRRPKNPVKGVKVPTVLQISEEE